MISLKAITIRAGERVFFDGASWSIESGQTWAVLGPTGAGKSLLAQVLARRWPLTHGDISYHFDPAGPSEGRSFLHQGEIQVFSAETHRAFLERYASYYQARWQSLEGEDNPTVRSFLKTLRGEIWGKNYPDPNGGDAHADPTGFPPGLPHPIVPLIDSLEILPILDRQIHLLSNGQSRKVFLAGLMFSAPRVLILDDPYIGLDTASHAALAGAVDLLIAAGEPQVLFFTSHPEEIPDKIGAVLGVRDGQFIFTAAGAKGLTPARLQTLFDSAPSAPHDSPQANHSALTAMADQFAADLRQKSISLPDPLIDLENVTIRYGEDCILKSVSWQVRRGERWLLSGPNGAGKSTLLSLIMADNPQAYANHVVLFGQQRGNGDSIWGIKRAIGYVSPELQAFYTFPSLDQPPFSCLQVAVSGFFDSVGLYRRPTPEQDKTARGWLEALGILDLSNRPFFGLSNGQKRLTLLVRALVKHPPMLVLDEPCQSLDTLHRNSFTRLIDSLCAKTSLTLIYVTHDPAEAPSALTHQICLDQGRVMKKGPIIRL